MKKYCTLLICLSLFACDKQTSSDTKKDGMTIVNDTIPETRSNIKSGAAASYSEPVADKDKLNNWKFSVDAFETSQTFKYLLKIQYKELRVEDTLTVPNFGIQPTVELKKGSEDLSCIVGFKGKENEFKEYKKVFVENGQLRITTIKAYRRALQKKK
jgi:hypothetical protein